MAPHTLPYSPVSEACDTLPAALTVSGSADLGRVIRHTRAITANEHSPLDSTPVARAGSRLPAHLLLAAASLAMSGLAMLREPLVNEDGIPFLLQSEGILGAMSGAAESTVTGWSLYAVLIAALQWLTGLGSIASAQLLDAALLVMLTLCFATLLEQIGTERRFFFWGALALLLFPRLNEFRAHIAADLGFWAFLVASLVPLARYLGSHRWEHAVGWALLTAVASAFRPEAVVFGALLPLACLAPGAEAPRLQAMIRLYAALLGLAVPPLVAAARFGFVPPVADLVFGSVQSMLHGIASGFSAASAHLGSTVLDQRASGMAGASLMAALAMVLLLELLRSLGLGYALLLGWAMLTRRSLLPEGGRGLQRSLAMAGLVIAGGFVAAQQFVGGRQLMPLCLALVVPCAFAARELLLAALQSPRPTAARIGLGVLVVALLADGFLSVGSRRSYLPESIAWIQKSVPPGSRVFSNDHRLAYYSGGKVAWDDVPSAAGQIASGIAAVSGTDYWLIHLRPGDEVLEAGIARYGASLVPVARFGEQGGPSVLVLRPSR